MSLIIEKEIYELLVKADLIKISQVSQRLPSGKVVLDEVTSSQFLSGKLFAGFLLKLTDFYPKQFEKLLANQIALNALKNATTPSSKLHNWNIICEALQKISIEIDQDVKNLIVAGDLDVVHGILKEILEIVQNKELNAKTDRNNKSSDASISILKKSTTMNTSILSQSVSPPQLHKEGNKAIDLNKIDVEKELSQCENLLEFFLCSVAKSMSFTPRQTVQMLSNNHKYLAHIVAKGIKDVFEPVIKWFKTLIANVQYLVALVAKEEDRKHTMEYVHHAVKVGLVSKDFEVAQNACRFFQKLAYEYLSQDLLSYAWEWFVSNQGGLQYCLLCIKRHPEIAEHAIGVIIEFARYNLMELFTHHLKSFQTDAKEFFITIRSLLKPLTESPLTKEELLTSGIIDVWLDEGLNALNEESEPKTDVKMLALGFLCDLWTVFPQKVEERETNATTIIAMLKKMTRDQSKNTSISSLTLLFRLLAHFSEKKNPFAPVIYKTLTFCLFENYNNISLRNIITMNFRQILNSIDSIPVGVVIEPLVKQLHLNENTNYNINMPDIEFLESLANHPKLGLKNSIQLLDVFAKLYLNNLIFAPIAGKCFIHIFSNFVSAEPLQEYIVKFVKISLAIFFTSEKSKRPKEKILPRYNNKHVNSKSVVSNQELEQEILNAQRRALIIEIIKSIIGLECDWVNKKAKTLILFTYRQLKLVTKSENKGILALISLFGQPTEVLAQFEEDLEKYENSPSPRGEPHGEDPEDINFFKELGIVKKKKKLDKSQITELAILKNSKPDPKIVNKIQEIQENFNDKILKEQQKEAVEKEKFQMSRKKLEVVLDKRKIELGVPFTKKSNVVEQITFEEGSKEAAKLYEKMKGSSEIRLVVLDNEEDRDQEGILVVLRKNTKILKHLFITYANSLFGGEDLPTFTALEQRKSVISFAELWKMLKDHDLKSRISQDETRELLRLINTQILKKLELKGLDFDGFQQFFVQVAVLIFSKPPKDLSHLPIFCSLQELLKHFRDATARRGKATILYDDPDSTEAVDKELSKFLNDALLHNPNYPLPEAYKKVYERDLDFKFVLPKTLNVSTKYRVVYEIIDDLIRKAINVRLVEPLTIFTTLAKAKPRLLSNPNTTRLRNQEPFIHKSLEEIVSLKRDHIPRPKIDNETNRSPIIRLDQKHFSFTLKKEILKLPPGYYQQGVEVAEVLEDLLKKVEMTAAGLPLKSSNSKIINLAIQEKIRMKEVDQKEREERDRKISERGKQVRHRLEELQHQKEEDDERKRSQIRKRTEQSDNQKDLTRMRYLEHIKEKVNDYRIQKEQEELAQKADERRKNYREQEQKKKKFREWNSMQLEKIKDNNIRIKEQRDEEERNRYKAIERNKEKELEYKRKRDEEIRTEKRKFERKKMTDEKIKGLLEKKEVGDLFKSNEKQLKQVFQWYVGSVHHVIGVPYKIDELVYKAFMNFAAEFAIHPTLLNLKEVQAIFRSITIHKPVEDRKPVTMSFKEFEEALLRIAIKAGDICNELYKHKTSNKGQKGDQGYDNIIKDYQEGREDEEQKHGDKDEEQKHGGEDEDGEEYEKIDQATMHTVEGLFFYLDLPQERQAVFDKLNSLRGSVIPFNEKKKNVKRILQGRTHPTMQEEPEDRREEEGEHHLQEEEEFHAEEEGEEENEEEENEEEENGGGEEEGEEDNKSHQEEYDDEDQ